ncbi:MAG TPA: hypothetical protein VH500_10590 [Nitrososphaeraceae archaeon]|jgi:hypothetical protein
MQVVSTSNSLYNVGHSRNHGSHPTFDTQCYLSPNYDSVCIQVEYLRNIILNESEKLYNQKIEELKNQTICEAAAYENNEITDVTDEKQSIKGLPLLGFAGS